MGFINSSAIFQRFLERKLRKHEILYEPTITVVIGTDTLETKDAMDNTDKTDGIDSIRNDTSNIKFDRKEVNNSKGYVGFCSCYQDDIVIHSDTAQEHKAHLFKLMSVLSTEMIPLNIQKSKFFCRFARYLGAVCGQGRLFTDPDKTDAINEMVVDKSQTGIRTFLGMAGFYRRWINHYSRIVRPLTDLLCKGVDVLGVWGDSQNRAIS